jgi:hypothetical protein
MSFKLTLIPDDVAFGGSLAMDPAEMKMMLAYGERCAMQGLAWVTASALLDLKLPAGAVASPADAPCALSDQTK